MNKLLLPLIAVSLLAGCANVTTSEHYQGFEGKPDKVCIINNPATKISLVVSGIGKALNRRGVEYSFVDSRDQCDCEYTIDYVARRSWDFTTYLGSADMTLYKNGKAVSSANYNAGEMTFTKWGRTEERIDNVVGQLFGEPNAE